MKAFTVSRISQGCPIDKINDLKASSFMQTKEKITLQGVKN